MKTIGGTLILACSLLLPLTIQASASTYTWTLFDRPVGLFGSGSLTTGAADGGGFDVITMSGTINGEIATLIGGNPGIGGAYSPTGAFTYDNIIFPDFAELTDIGGLLLTLTSTHREANIFEGSPYAYYTSPGSGYDTQLNDARFTLALVNEHGARSEVPEPGTLAVFGTGLFCMGLLRRWHAKTAGLAKARAGG